MPCHYSPYSVRLGKAERPGQFGQLSIVFGPLVLVSYYPICLSLSYPTCLSLCLKSANPVHAQCQLLAAVLMQHIGSSSKLNEASNVA